MTTATGNGHVVVMGQGYVGLPLAMRAVEVGHRVVGYDIDDRRVSALASGRSFVEDVTDTDLRRALATARYEPSSDSSSLAGFGIAVITVPTPLRDGSPDLSFVEQATRALAPHLRPGSTVVLESTTYPGTTEDLIGPMLAELTGLTPEDEFNLGFSPERIDPGNAQYPFHRIPKVVSGVGPRSLAAVEAFYGELVDKVVPVRRPREAELAKLIENTFRHVNIALVNELAMFANDVDIDIWEALDAAASKPFGFMRFNPGPGVGGHCLPIDPSYLSWHLRTIAGRTFRFVELANDVNDHMPDYVANRVLLTLNRLGIAASRSSILLLGLTYKRNTSDARESPAIRVAQRLADFGSTLAYVDSHISPKDLGPLAAKVRPAQATPDELHDADLTLLLVDHDDVDYDVVVDHSGHVLDTRHRCRGAMVEYL
ncbi:MAG TPA: nucleotide sugar dehydrogenase [Acidimicrobiales bacterium]|nr:nucleotide sugar dehydrogenase [Acidimicrobiales bacterium]